MVVAVNGLKIKEERIKQGCSQEHLSEKAGMPESPPRKTRRGLPLLFNLHFIQHTNIFSNLYLDQF